MVLNWVFENQPLCITNNYYSKKKWLIDNWGYYFDIDIDNQQV
jgi:hypothetical protein